MNVLLIGEGAREHIIAEHLAKDAKLFAIMSKKNPAIAKLSEDFYVCNTENEREIKAWASGRRIDLAYVSPDAILASGMSDALISLGIPTVSPTKDVADIECNKQFARELMEDHKIPGLVGYKLVENESDAMSAIREFKYVAIKPIGLTGGKGVKVSGDHFNSEFDAMKYVKELLNKDGKLLIEEKLQGEEFTLQAFSDGTHLAFMPPVQDHKRAFVGDAGPNTGGMGSYSTGELLPFMNEEDLEKAKHIMKKTILTLKKERAEFKGVLYGQFMLTKDGPKVIEYNARFGDPEAINVLTLLRSSLVETFESIADGRLKEVKFDNISTVVKYLVPEGYPTNPKKDALVHVDEQKIKKSGAKVYYASVYEKEGNIHTTGSRAFAVVSAEQKISDAEKNAERALAFIEGPLFHRKDIGTKSLIQKRIEHMKEIRG